MDRVGVRELRQNLSVYLRRVANGEALTVTDHGHAVAMLAPLPADDHPLSGLAAAGKVRLSQGRVADLPAPQSTTGASLTEILAAMRDEDER